MSSEMKKSLQGVDLESNCNPEEVAQITRHLEYLTAFGNLS
jgi:hypothetical protein